MRLLTILCIACLSALSWDPVSAQDNAPWPPSKNWGLRNDKGVHIRATEEWSELDTTAKIAVAVIDTGIDGNHNALSVNISRFGHDFIGPALDRDCSVARCDDNGHGTHVAGIIDAVSHSHALLVPLKFFSDSNPGEVNLRNAAKAVNWAVNHKIRVINYSGGGPEFSEDEYIALKRAEKAGIIVVTAAGNEHQNIDLTENQFYPSAYKLSNIVSVTSIDIYGNMPHTSNWGRKTVDLGAPGDKIFSALPGDRFGFMSGTSQATAFVTGVVVAMLAENPKLTPKQIKAILTETVQKTDALKDKTVSGGYLNGYAAVKQAKSMKNFTIP